MLVSDMIKKLEVLRKERGDLPVYFKTDYDTLKPLTMPWVEMVDEDQVNDELNLGVPIICIG